MIKHGPLLVNFSFLMGMGIGSGGHKVRDSLSIPSRRQQQSCRKVQSDHSTAHLLHHCPPSFPLQNHGLSGMSLDVRSGYLKASGLALQPYPIGLEGMAPTFHPIPRYTRPLRDAAFLMRLPICSSPPRPCPLPRQGSNRQQ